MKMYDTLKEAKEVRDELNTRGYGDKFCPITQSKCRTNCVCWHKATVERTHHDRFRVIEGFCNNRMLHGRQGSL